MTDPAVFRKSVEIRFADVDYARVLYFPRELHLLHVVMEDFFREAIGIPYADVLGRERLGFPTVRLEADFRAPLRFGDRAEVAMRVLDIGRSRLVFEYVIERTDTRAPVARVVQTTVAVDPEKWRSIEIPAKVRERLLPYRVAGSGHG